MRRLAVLLLCALALPVSVAQAWTWPVDGPVLRPFLFDRAHPYTAGQHRGVDLGAPAGAPVVAPSEGVVKFAGTVPTGGKTVSIETPGGQTATLVHLGSYAVKRGDVVAEGVVVGTVGPSGVTELTQPFVYFGVRTTSDPQGYLDPLTFLPARLAPRAEPVAPAAPAEVAPAVAASPESVEPAQPAAQTAAAPATANVPAVTTQPEPAAVVSAANVAAAQVFEKPRAVAPRRPLAERAHASLPAGSDEARSSRYRPAVRPAVQRSRGAPSHERLAARQTQPSRPLARAPSPRVSSDLPSPWRSLGVAFALAFAGIVGLYAAARGDLWTKVARIIRPVPEPEHVDLRAEPKTEEDPGRAGLALRLREAAPGPRGRVRRAGGHLRALPPPEGERRVDGERDRRAWDAGHGHGRSRGRLAA